MAARGQRAPGSRAVRAPDRAGRVDPPRGQVRRGLRPGQAPDLRRCGAARRSRRPRPRRRRARLEASAAPETVANFVRLARAGVYDGTTFHRVVAGFVVQGGDPRGDGFGGPGYVIPCEVTDRPFAPGVVGMALAGKDTGGSQFFVMQSRQPHLDGHYTVFGEVVEGLEVVDSLQPDDLIRRVEIVPAPRADPIRQR
ncbi:MAG: peptidylprolyl isomerase [Deltaproteobacteria bacterium]|nr:peptidylprolyl isomerase [Deltaproteobacteria bacterium]